VRFSIIRVPMTNRIEARYVLFGNLLFRPDELWKKGLRPDAEFTAALIDWLSLRRLLQDIRR
jgi:hypothetical protein